MARTIPVLPWGSRRDSLCSQLHRTCKSGFPNQMLRTVFQELWILLEIYFSRNSKRFLSKVMLGWRQITQGRRAAGRCHQKAP